MHVIDAVLPRRSSLLFSERRCGFNAIDAVSAEATAAAITLPDSLITCSRLLSSFHRGMADPVCIPPGRAGLHDWCHVRFQKIRVPCWKRLIALQVAEPAPR